MQATQSSILKIGANYYTITGADEEKAKGCESGANCIEISEKVTLCGMGFAFKSCTPFGWFVACIGCTALVQLHSDARATNKRVDQIFEQYKNATPLSNVDPAKYHVIELRQFNLHEKP